MKLAGTHHSPSENFAAQRSPFFGVYDPGNGGLLSSSDLICSINVTNNGPDTTHCIAVVVRFVRNLEHDLSIKTVSQ